MFNVIARRAALTPHVPVSSTLGTFSHGPASYGSSFYGVVFNQTHTIPYKKLNHTYRLTLSGAQAGADYVYRRLQVNIVKNAACLLYATFAGQGSFDFSGYWTAATGYVNSSVPMWRAAGGSYNETHLASFTTTNRNKFVAGGGDTINVAVGVAWRALGLGCGASAISGAVYYYPAYALTNVSCNVTRFS